MTKRKLKTYSICALLCILCMLVTGFDNPVVLDTQNNKVYTILTADLIVDRYDNKATNINFYIGNYYAIPGKVAGKSADNKNLYIKGCETKSTTKINCIKADKTIVNSLKKDDMVVVLGKFEYDSISKEIKITVDAIKKTENEINEYGYMTIDGTIYYDKDMKNCDINGNIHYSIPKNWKSVEHNIETEKLGTITGYQYRLNEIKGERAVNAESFFVCYFDSNRLAKDGVQINSGNIREIEKIIIDNIVTEGNVENRTPLINVKNYYGVVYDIYQGNCSLASGSNYFVAFAFRQMDEKGMVVYMYVYKDKKHINDIYTVMRTLK